MTTVERVWIQVSMSAGGRVRQTEDTYTSKNLNNAHPLA